MTDLAETREGAGARIYAEWHERLGGFETHRAAMDWIAPGSRVVDVGCSTGYFARLLAKEKGSSVIGIEQITTPPSFSHARER